MPSVVPFLRDRKPIQNDKDLSLLSRPQLLDILCVAANQKACWLNGPAGAGKTVLLHQYIQQHQPQKTIAYIRLDTFDQDSAYFFCKLCTAIQHQIPGFTGFSTPQRSSQIERIQIESAMNILVAELSRLSQPIQIIIDNFEVLAHCTWLPVIPLMVELCPSQVSWIFSGRTIPQPVLQKIVDNASISIIDHRHLFFTKENTHNYLLNHVQGNITSSAADAVFQFTQGWPAAIKIAQLHFHYASNAQTVQRELTTQPDFSTFFNQTLAILPTALHHFLINVAFLESFNAKFCDHVLRDMKSAAHIEHLCSLNMLIEPAEEPGEYRFHDLLREQLLKHFNQQPAHIRDRHIARACTWLIENGKREVACRIAQHHTQRSFFQELLRQSFRIWFRTGNSTALLYWTQHFSNSTSENRTDFLFAASWVSIMRGEFVAAESTLKEMLRLDGTQKLSIQILLNNIRESNDITKVLVYAFIRLFRGGLTPELIEHLNRLYNQPALSITQRANLDNLFAQHAIYHSHFRESRQRANQALQVLDKRSNPFAYSIGVYLVANSYYQNNDIKQALSSCNEHLKSVNLEIGTSSRALLDAFHAYLIYQSDQALVAEKTIYQLLAHYQPSYTIDLQLFLTLPLLHLQTRRGQFEKARFFLQQLETSAQMADSPILQAHTVYEKIRLAYAQGNSREIELLAEQYSVLEKVGFALKNPASIQWEALERVTMAAVLVAMQQQDWTCARQWVQTLQHLNIDLGYPIRFLPLNMCLALLDYKLGHVSAAFRRLNDSLIQADATGMLTGLLDEIPDLDAFVKLAITNQRILDPLHVQKLLDARILQLQPDPDAKKLNTTEYVIAQALQQNHTLEDVANRFLMADASIHWHLRNLMWKLDVHNHQQLQLVNLNDSHS